MPEKNPNVSVKVTDMGNVIEIQYMSRRNTKQTIQMLPGGEQYVLCATGEVLDVVHHETRKDNKKGLYKTFANARGIINANVVDVSKVRWCTLTYGGEYGGKMTDTVKLYEDFEKFNKRFQYYCKTKRYSKPEYIVMMEPQRTGSWHAHLLYVWQDQKAPFISNQDFRELWSHGFVTIKNLNNVDNVGAYLTAYLGDMEFQDAIDSGQITGEIKTVEVENEKGEMVKKSFVKGARLHLYPAGFNMLRCSRGIKRPEISLMSQFQAEKKVQAATKTFESAIRLTDSDTEFETIIIKEQYNKIRKKTQY